MELIIHIMHIDFNKKEHPEVAKTRLKGGQKTLKDIIYMRDFMWNVTTFVWFYVN